MRVAIVGLGAIVPNHINALLECEQEIVALCDIDAAKPAATNEKYGLSAACYTDFEQMLDEVKPDAVHICTPHYLHAPMCCAALSRGIHVLCEKPLAISKQQLEMLGDAVKRSHAQLGVCHQNRFRAALQYAKELFAKDAPTAAAASMIWHRNASYYTSAAWRGTWDKEGGGVMINQALHTLDLLQWFCGFPRTVVAHVSNDSLQGVIEVEDTAHAVFALEHGGKFVFDATNAASHSFPVQVMLHGNGRSVQICGDQVTVNGVTTTHSDGKPKFGKIEWGVAHVKLIRRYYECLKTGEPFEIGFEEGRRVIDLILAMYRSEGKEIPTL